MKGHASPVEWAEDIYPVLLPSKYKVSAPQAGRDSSSRGTWEIYCTIPVKPTANPKFMNSSRLILYNKSALPVQAGSMSKDR